MFRGERNKGDGLIVEQAGGGDQCMLGTRRVREGTKSLEVLEVEKKERNISVSTGGGEGRRPV